MKKRIKELLERSHCHDVHLSITVNKDDETEIITGEVYDVIKEKDKIVAYDIILINEEGQKKGRRNLAVSEIVDCNEVPELCRS